MFGIVEFRMGSPANSVFTLAANGRSQLQAVRPVRTVRFGDLPEVATPEQREVVASGARSGVGLALLAAVTLDGVPENLALGVPLVGGLSLSLLVAIFFSNLPEALVGAVAMRESGLSRCASRGWARAPWC